MEPTVEDQLLALARIGGGALVGAALGWERERRGRPAGLRTFAAVGMASALIMVLADMMLGVYAGDSMIQSDPTRVLEAVVGGVAFLGGGTIIVNRGSDRVRGLTTAAGLLVTSVLGVAAGIGAWVLAVAGTLAMLAVLGLANALGPRSSDAVEADGDTDGGKDPGGRVRPGAS